MTNRLTRHAQHRHNYRVRVKNFGPITEGDVEFRPLTVFVGPSNTGKSYLATMIYALHRCFAENLDIFPHSLPWEIGPTGLTKRTTIDPEIKKDLDAWLTSAEEEGNLPSMPKRVEGAICSMIEGAEDMALPIKREICRCFGTETVSELIRRPRAQAAEIVVDLHQRNEQCRMQYHLGIRRNDGFKVTGRILGCKTPFSDLVQSSKDVSNLRRFAYRMSVADKREASYLFLLAELGRMTQYALANSLGRSTYYLPASRTGVMHSHKVVVSALVQLATTAGLRSDSGVPSLSGVLADFLRQLIQMPDKHGSKRNKANDALASQVEQTILRGRIRVDAPDENYPNFVYRPNGWKEELPLMRSSSMVSELAPIVLYLRHVVRPGNVLIIEEPESHLHPAMQVKVIRCLAEVVRSGIQVIVTTHSEWVLDELASMVLTSQVEQSDQATPDKTTRGIHPHEVGVWSFKHQKAPEGIVVKELSTDDTGLYPSGFDHVAVDQHNRWADVASRIEESKNASH